MFARLKMWDAHDHNGLHPNVLSALSAAAPSCFSSLLPPPVIAREGGDVLPTGRFRGRVGLLRRKIWQRRAEPGQGVRACSRRQHLQE